MYFHSNEPWFLAKSVFVNTRHVQVQAHNCMWNKQISNSVQKVLCFQAFVAAWLGNKP